jgi:hypothetical protein
MTGPVIAGEATETILLMNPTVWFASMLPWALLGTLLMGYLWRNHRGKTTAGT